jgi:broad specificity phosphatase PhoE
MHQVTLIRHAITDWNVAGKFQGHSDITLSESGIAQARCLAERCKRWQVDRVVSSPLKRTLETARIVFPDRDLELDDRLKEIHFGAFEGYTHQQNMTHAAWVAWIDDPFLRPAPGGESYQQVMARAVAWLEALPKTGHTVAVTHAGVIRMLVSHVLGLKRPTWRKRIVLGHTSITRIIFDGRETLLERVNDTAHLQVD